LEKVRPKLESVPGFLGLYLLQRTQGTEIEYCVQTLWESIEAIRAFAGPAPDEAVVEPEAAAMLKRYDRRGGQHQVLIAPPRSRCTSAFALTPASRAGCLTMSKPIAAYAFVRDQLCCTYLPRAGYTTRRRNGSISAM